MDYRGHKVFLGGSYAGNTTELLKGLVNEGILHFSNVGREFTIQVRSEDLEDVIKSLRKLGVDNLNILEWKKYGTTISNSGSSQDEGVLVNVSLIPSALGSGLRPLSVTQRVNVERKLYIEMLANIEIILVDAGISDALYALHIDKDATKAQYLDAVKESTLIALFNAGGVVGIE